MGPVTGVRWPLHLRFHFLCSHWEILWVVSLAEEEILCGLLGDQFCGCGFCASQAVIDVFGLPCGFVGCHAEFLENSFNSLSVYLASVVVGSMCPISVNMVSGNSYSRTLFNRLKGREPFRIIHGGYFLLL